MLPVFALAFGSAALWVGGEQFVLGASRLAERTRIPIILVGMIVAGFGTSMPELVVSTVAQARGESGLALGNALGSNVANVLLVLPLSALAAAWTVRGDLLRREIAAVLGGTALMIGLVADGSVSRPEAAVLLAGFCAVMSWLALAGMRARERPAIEAEIEALVGVPPRAVGILRESLRTLAGLGIILVSADRLVWGAGRVARELGLSEATIGLTIVAVGTSLPEVVTAVIAARRGKPDLVLGNVLGSNLFNGLLIIGVAAMIGPLGMSGAPLPTAIVGTSLATLALVAFLPAGSRVTRPQAILGLAGYAGFVGAIYAAA